MKKILVILLGALGLTIIGCNSKDKNGEITLTMAEVGGENTISSRMDKFFKEKVEELSGGKIKINLQLNGVYGGEEEVIKMMQNSSSPVQLCRVSTFSLTSFGAKKSILPTIPFTFKNRNHFWKFAESRLAQELLVEPYDEKIGIRGLFFAEEGFRHFFSADQLESIEDLKGKKIRVASDPLFIRLVEAFGSEPVFVTTNDIFAALQTGKTDCAEQPVSAYLSNSFNTVAPNIILDGHTLGVTEVVISSKCWDSLSKSQQEILNEAGKLAATYCREISEKAVAEALEELKLQGAKITEVNDLTEWEKIVKPIADEYSKDFPELYQKILEL